MKTSAPLFGRKFYFAAIYSLIGLSLLFFRQALMFTIVCHAGIRVRFEIRIRIFDNRNVYRLFILPYFRNRVKTRILCRTKKTGAPFRTFLLSCYTIEIDD